MDWKLIFFRGFEKGIEAALTAALIGAATFLWSAFSNGEVVRILGGVTPQMLEEALSKLPLPGPMPSPAKPRAFELEAVRFGKVGSSENGRNEGEPFDGNDGPRRFASAKEFPVCTFTELRMINGSCKLSQIDGDWQITTQKEIACGVTCYRPRPQ